MAPKVFITGATGYIGGDALHELLQQHPDWQSSITCLVRSSDKAAKVAAVYPSIRFVYGNLDDVGLIEDESSKADIIYHFANCDHEPSAAAIVRGISSRPTGQTPAFYIHTSGTMILSDEFYTNTGFGSSNQTTHDDLAGVAALTSRPDAAAHRVVDKIVLAAAEKTPDKIRTAIVCPPTIFGVGRGPDNTRSQQVYGATESFMKNGKAFMIGEGRNTWHEVHVHDLSRLYVLLGEAAANGGGDATWGKEGYYLAENGEFLWGDVLKLVAAECKKQGYLESDEIIGLEKDDLQRNGVPEVMGIMVGTNSRGVARRGREVLGWSPKEGKLRDEIPRIVESEARRTGAKKGHREIVAGE